MSLAATLVKVSLAICYPFEHPFDNQQAYQRLCPTARSMPAKPGIVEVEDQCAASVEAVAPNLGRDSHTMPINKKNSSDDA